ncbi:unnamed protein product [Rhodiola kirilowii]
MWNIRSENWARQVLGSAVLPPASYSPANSWRDEYPIPINAQVCGTSNLVAKLDRYRSPYAT